MVTPFIAEGVTAERQQRARAGAALCRQAIAAVLASRTARTVPDWALTPSEVIYRRARERAAAERRPAGDLGGGTR